MHKTKGPTIDADAARRRIQHVFKLLKIPYRLVQDPDGTFVYVSTRDFVTHQDVIERSFQVAPVAMPDHNETMLVERRGQHR
jgi:hypothetical protein